MTVSAPNSNVSQLWELYKLAGGPNGGDQGKAVQDTILKLINDGAKLQNLSEAELQALVKITKDALQDGKFTKQEADFINSSANAAGGSAETQGLDELMKDPRFREAMEKYEESKGGTPQEQAKAAKELAEQINRMAQEEEAEAQGAGKGSRGKSWLRAIAAAFGKIADKLANELQAAADKIGAGGNKPSDLTDFQVKSMEFSQLMQTITSGLKSLGEGTTAPAQAAR